jgi:hypothetical protein
VAKIEVICPGCGKKIGVEIATVDRLRAEAAAAIRERDTLKRRLAALEAMSFLTGRDSSSPSLDELMRMFDGKGKKGG